MRIQHFIWTISLTLLASCDLVNQDQNPQNEIPLNDIFSAPPSTDNPGSMSSGWKVAFMEEEGIDLTSNFKEIEFSFSQNGELNATSNQESVKGTWRFDRDTPKNELYLIFPAGSVLEELTEDWYIVMQTDNLIQLEYPEEGFTNHLVFTKNTISPISTSSPQNATVADQLFEKVNTKSFSIESFWDAEDNMSSAFRNFELQFNNLGRLELKRPNQPSISGLWQVNFTQTEIFLDIELKQTGLIGELDEEWTLVQKSDGRIEFKEVEENEIYRLTLKRN